jgi:hypothetical protein
VIRKIWSAIVGEVFMLMIVLGLLALSIWGFMQTAKQSNQKQEIEAKIKQIPGFTSSKTLVKTGLMTREPRGFSIDPESQQICLIGGGKLRLLPFSMILESEVVVDGQTVNKTSRASQVVGTAIGAAIGGGVGAIIGGLSATSHSKQVVNNVFLRIILNDLETPIHGIEFVEMTNYGNSPGSVALMEAENWHALLKIVVFQGKH